MAFSLPTAGTRYNLQNGNCVPKKPAAAYTTPAVGHLASFDNTGSDFVVHTADGAAPDFYVLSVNSSNGTLSCIRLRGCTFRFEYNASDAPSIGDKIAASNATAVIPIGGVLGDAVEQENATGVGRVIAKDDVLGTVVVEFPGVTT
jgi:hypothetical protein